jgi:hypothetical protein
MRSARFCGSFSSCTEDLALAKSARWVYAPEADIFLLDLTLGRAECDRDMNAQRQVAHWRKQLVALEHS